MSNFVFLNLGKGCLHKGFPFVSARFHLSGRIVECSGSLPAAPKILEIYRRWQLLYELLYKARSFKVRSPLKSEDLDTDFDNLYLDKERGNDDDDICIDEADITHVSSRDFTNICSELQQSLNDWLDSPDFRPIERQLRRQLKPEAEIYFIIQTDNYQLRRLPWYIWQFFADYPRAEISLGSLNFEPTKQISTVSNKVRILAILGDSTGIEIQQDKQLLTKIPGAEIVFLVEPKRQELDDILWDKKGWDILFFAGHSYSLEDNATGKIVINSEESLTIPELKSALKKAIERGLKLAIFNSCDGLGLAAQLIDLSLPQMIVMREPVPDLVAQQFLKYFLSAYSKGQSFPLAVREARERLQSLEGKFPGASWLPVIFQNPAEVPRTWQQLKTKFNFNSHLAPRSFSARPPKLTKVFLTSTIATILLMALRWLGALQVWELKAFDYFLQKIPSEPADRRILIVGTDEEDLSRYGYPLPDWVLAQVIEKLQSHQPAAIGLDIFRDRPVPGNDFYWHQALVKHFEQDSNLVAVCAGDNLQNSVAPPLQSPPQQVSFVDLPDDRSLTKGQDDTIRRYLLSRSPNPVANASRCTSSYSLALQLVARYFQTQNIPVTTSGENWQFGSQIVKRLANRSAGYQTLDARGNQLLIFYRNVTPIAQKVTIRDILDNRGNFDPTWVRNRVVLIGMDDRAITIQDLHDTPRGKISGVSIHAHVVSQILSAVENNRPLFWWLPQWGDTIWVWCWSLTGGIVMWFWRVPLLRSLAVTGSVAILTIVCWLGFIRGAWLPFVPSAFGIILTGSYVVVWENSQHERKNNY